jgi:hypothetical protein
LFTDVVVDKIDANDVLRWAGHCLESRNGAVYYDGKALVLEQDLPTDWFAFVRRITGSIFMPLGTRWLELRGVPATALALHAGTKFTTVPEAAQAAQTVEARSGALYVNDNKVDADALLGDASPACLEWAVFAQRLALLD